MQITISKKDCKKLLSLIENERIEYYDYIGNINDRLATESEMSPEQRYANSCFISLALRRLEYLDKLKKKLGG